MTERDHSRIGPSSAKRWMNCAGSVRMSEGLPSRAGKAAEDGTEVHVDLEWCLKEGKYPDATGPENDAIRMFIDHVRQLDVSLWWPEVKVHIPEFLSPPEPMYGTADYIGYSYDDHTLHVVDLKYGLQLVDVVNNEQLLYYAVMAYYYLRGRHIDQVTMTIVQPRVSHPQGPVRSWTIPVKTMFEFAGKLLNKARDTQEPDAPLVPGDWCMFCPAAPHCPALREKAYEVAQQEFSSYLPVLTAGSEGEVAVTKRSVDSLSPMSEPPTPSLLPTDILADIGRQLPILKMWIGAMDGEIERRLLEGEYVEGFALADKRAWRKWNPENTDKLIEFARGIGLDITEWQETLLKSPAQIEKLIGKKNMKELGGFVTKGTPGKKVVRTGDPEALPSAEEEFTALPPATLNTEE